MRDIDFLPLQYRQKHAKRKSRLWLTVIVVVFATLLGGSLFTQRTRMLRAEEELAAIEPQYQWALAQNRILTETQTRLGKAREVAQLYTYLRHPWPRTQLLAAVVAPVPEGVTLDELRISREAVQDSASGARSKTESEAEEKVDKLPAATRDLRRLRDESDHLKTVVLLLGTTLDGDAVHHYLSGLGTCDLFDKAELDWINSGENEHNGKLRFRAVLIVRPGYGQPGGPTTNSMKVAMQTPPQENGNRPHLPGRPDGCFAPMGIVPFFAESHNAH